MGNIECDMKELLEKDVSKILRTPDEQLTPRSKTKKIMHEAYNGKSGRNMQKKKVACSLLFHNTLTSSMKKSYKKSRKSIKKTFS